MHIYVNGDRRDLAEGSTVEDLLGELKIREEQVAVEVNLKIVDRGEFGKCALKDSDRVEIISFIGGGGESGELDLSHCFIAIG